MRRPTARAARLSGAALVALLISGCTSSSFPEISDDGLERVARTSNGAIYETPGLDLPGYGQIAVDDCTVGFRDDWQRDQNRDRDPSRRVTTEDMRRIAQELADMCRGTFAAELAQVELGAGDTPEDAATLTVRPAIVDLDIAAPDLQTPGRDRTYITTAGRMTLRLELVDTASGAVVGRVIDRRQATTSDSPRRASRIRNRIEAELILEQWATKVREYLEAALE